MKKLNTIQLKTKRGFNLEAFEGDSITREVQKKGEYDTNTLNSLVDILTLIKPNVSLDVGANIGNHVLLIAELSNKVFAFEPVKFVFDVLQSNIKSNAVKNITAVNVGLSNAEAQHTIYIQNNGNLGSSSMEVANDASEKLDIQTVVGDAYLQKCDVNSQIDFIKIDVEGHEAKALTGLKQTLLKHQPLVLIEWKDAQMLAEFKRLNLFEELFQGYQKYALTYTTNKKVYAGSCFGCFKRLYHKLIGSHWCLMHFDEDKMYSNVYFVPPRFQQHFEANI